jgi:hypothetical protein
VGYLGYFHRLTSVNGAAIKMGVLCSNLSHVPSGVFLGVVLLDHVVDLCLVF